MKITSFNPTIVTKDAEEMVSLFEELGFERRHQSTVVDEGKTIYNYRMSDGSGFKLDVIQTSEVPKQDVVTIRMNVDDFDEAYQKLLARGFKNVNGDHVIRTDYSVSTVMLAPSGFAINLIQHIRKEDI